MSPFSIVLIVVIVVSLVAGVLSKLLFRKRRRDLDGFHGYVLKQEPPMDDEDGWE